MKSSTVWHGRSTRPSLPAGTVRKASGHLSGRRHLHLANTRPFGRSKAPLGLLLLRKRELAYGRQNRLILQEKKNRKLPMGNSLLYISLLSVAFGRVRPIQGRILFFYCASSFSTRSIRYPTPTWVWIRCGVFGHRSSFLRRDAI